MDATDPSAMTQQFQAAPAHDLPNEEVGCTDGCACERCDEERRLDDAMRKVGPAQVTIVRTYRDGREDPKVKAFVTTRGEPSRTSAGEGASDALALFDALRELEK